MNVDYIYGSLPVPIRSRLKRIMMATLKKKLKTFYSQFITPGKLVFDIGANDGDYTEVFLELGGNVVSIEPQPDCYTKLRVKFRDETKVKILAYGVGKSKKTVDFYISSYNNPNSSFSTDFMKNTRYSYRSWDKVIKVPMTTLNELIQKHGVPDFCKIDVEGYEWEILTALKYKIPVISFEFIAELNEKAIDIIRHLETLGKGQYNFCLGMSYKYTLKKWSSGKEMIKLLKDNEHKGWNGDMYVKFMKRN